MAGKKIRQRPRHRSLFSMSGVDDFSLMDSGRIRSSFDPMGLNKRLPSFVLDFRNSDLMTREPPSLDLLAEMVKEEIRQASGLRLALEKVETEINSMESRVSSLSISADKSTSINDTYHLSYPNTQHRPSRDTKSNGAYNNNIDKSNTNNIDKQVRFTVPDDVRFQWLGIFQQPQHDSDENVSDDDDDNDNGRNKGVGCFNGMDPSDDSNVKMHSSFPKHGTFPSSTINECVTDLVATQNDHLDKEDCNNISVSLSHTTYDTTALSCPVSQSHALFGSVRALGNHSEIGATNIADAKISSHYNPCHHYKSPANIISNTNSAPATIDNDTATAATTTSFGTNVHIVPSSSPAYTTATTTSHVLSPNVCLPNTSSSHSFSLSPPRSQSTQKLLGTQDHRKDLIHTNLQQDSLSVSPPTSSASSKDPSPLLDDYSGAKPQTSQNQSTNGVEIKKYWLKSSNISALSASAPNSNSRNSNRPTQTNQKDKPSANIKDDIMARRQLVSDTKAAYLDNSSVEAVYGGSSSTSDGLSRTSQYLQQSQLSKTKDGHVITRETREKGKEESNDESDKKDDQNQGAPTTDYAFRPLEMPQKFMTISGRRGRRTSAKLGGEFYPADQLKNSYSQNHNNHTSKSRSSDQTGNGYNRRHSTSPTVPFASKLDDCSSTKQSGITPSIFGDQGRKIRSTDAYSPAHTNGDDYISKFNSVRESGFNFNIALMHDKADKPAVRSSSHESAIHSGQSKAKRTSNKFDSGKDIGHFFKLGTDSSVSSVEASDAKRKPSITKNVDTAPSRNESLVSRRRNSFDGSIGSLKGSSESGSRSAVGPPSPEIPRRRAGTLADEEPSAGYDQTDHHPQLSSLLRRVTISSSAHGSGNNYRRFNDGSSHIAISKALFRPMFKSRAGSFGEKNVRTDLDEQRGDSGGNLKDSWRTDSEVKARAIKPQSDLLMKSGVFAGESGKKGSTPAAPRNYKKGSSALNHTEDAWTHTGNSIGRKGDGRKKKYSAEFIRSSSEYNSNSRSGSRRSTISPIPEPTNRNLSPLRYSEDSYSSKSVDTSRSSKSRDSAGDSPTESPPLPMPQPPLQFASKIGKHRKQQLNRDIENIKNEQRGFVMPPESSGTSDHARVTRSNSVAVDQASSHLSRTKTEKRNRRSSWLTTINSMLGRKE